MWYMIEKNSKKCTCSLERAVESSVECCADTAPSAPLKSKTTQDGCCCNDNSTGCCQSSPSGTMSAPSTEDLGEEQLTLFAEASPAKTLVRRVKERELPESVAAYGKSMQESLARCGLDLSLPKTRHSFALGVLELSSKTWPRWGMMQDGVCWEVGTRVRHINERGCGYLPTPLKSDGNGGVRNLERTAKLWNTRDWWAKIGLGRRRQDRQPMFWEWLMRWPMGWTDLKPLETDKIQEWLSSHGKR